MAGKKKQTTAFAGHAREISLYVLVGILGLLLDSGVFFSLIYFGCGPVVSQWAGASIGAIHNSIWHHYAVFNHDMSLRHTAIPNTMLSFFTVAISGPILLAVSQWLDSVIAAKIIVLGGTTVATYLFRKMLIFRNRGVGVILISFGLLLSGTGAARSEEDAGTYDENGVFYQESTDPQIVATKEEVGKIFGEIASLQSASRDKISEHRDYRLAPAIRAISKKAQETKSLELVKSAVALASCESNPSKSHDWVYEFCGALNSFTEEDFKGAVESLPVANRKALWNTLSKKAPSSFQWRTALEKIVSEDSAYLDE